MIKQKRKEKAVCLCWILSDSLSLNNWSSSSQLVVPLTTLLGLAHFAVQGKWSVPLPKVRAIGENEVMRQITTGKKGRKFSQSKTGEAAAPELRPHPIISVTYIRREILEAHDHQAHVCRRGLYAQAAEVRALHPPHGPPCQEGEGWAGGVEIVCVLQS